MTDPRVTPTLTEFEVQETADPNAWWRLECGDHLNLFDEARDALRESEARCAKLEARLASFKQSGGQWKCSVTCWCEGGPHDDGCSFTPFYVLAADTATTQEGEH